MQNKNKKLSFFLQIFFATLIIVITLYIFKVNTDYNEYKIKQDIFILTTTFTSDINSIKNDKISDTLPTNVSLKHINDISFVDKSLPIDNLSYFQAPNEWPLTEYSVVSNSEESEPIVQENQLTTLFFGGEIIPARAVDRLGLNKHENYTYLFDFVREDIQNADIAMALLENPVNGNPSPCTGCMLFVGDDGVINGLEEVGFDILSLAGNHAGDGGQSAYVNTIELLNQSKIEHLGVTNNYDHLLEPIIIDKNNIRFGFLAADDVAFYYWKLNPDSANYGTNYFSKRDKNGILEIDSDRISKISDIKTKNAIDIMIVYMSWGVEYTNKATNHQQKLAHELIDNDVDIVIGSHPHWVQNVEVYKNKPIIYSLGNFIFDQTHTLETRQGALAKLHFINLDLKNIEFIPIQACGYHQTQNDLASKYLSDEITLEEVYELDDNQGCVYWQPKKLKPTHPGYKQIMDRIYEYNTIRIPSREGCLTAPAGVRVESKFLSRSRGVFQIED